MNFWANISRWSNDKLNLVEDVKNTSETFANKISAIEERATKAEQRLLETETEKSVEREWRLSLQQKESDYKEQLTNAHGHIKELKEKLESSVKLKKELEAMQHLWSEAQRTMEELGVHLSESKLKIAKLEEEKQYLRRRSKQQMGQEQSDALDSNTEANESVISAAMRSVSLGSSSTQAPLGGGRLISDACGIWAPDSIASNCAACKREFNLTRRKHHCRSCGEIFCHPCSDFTLPLQLNNEAQLGKPVRVCSSCFEAHK